MHALDYVATIVEHAPYILRVNGAREVGIAIVFALAGRGRDLEEFVANEILGAGDELRVLWIH